MSRQITYKATATLSDEKKIWDVIIYSLYNSYEDALDGVRRFLNPTGGKPTNFVVVKIVIEPEANA